MSPSFRLRLFAWPAVALFGILATAAGLRIWGVGAKSLWFDEAFTVFVAGRPPGEILSFIRANDAHPPLYYLLTNLMIPIWSREVDLRVLSVLAGSLTVAVAFLFGRRLLGDRPALIAALLLALSPFHIMASQEGRMYALLSLLVLLSWASLWSATRIGGSRWWFAYALATALSLYNHGLGIVVLVSQGVFVLAEPSARRAFRSWTLAASAAIALFLPWVPALMDQLAAGRVFPGDRAGLPLLSLAELGALFQFGGGLYQTAAYIPNQRSQLPPVYLVPLLAPLVMTLAAATAGLRRRPQLLFLGSYLLLPIVPLLVVPLSINPFQVRYAVILTPAFALAAAAGIEELGDLWQRGGGRANGMRAFMLLWLGLFAAAGLGAHYKNATWDGYDWRGGVGYVDNRAATLDTLAMIPGVINIPQRVYGRRVRLTVLGDPKAWLDPGHAPEREKLTTALRQGAGHGDVWLMTLLPLVDPLTAALSKDLAGVLKPGERRDFGSLVVIRFTRTLAR